MARRSWGPVPRGIDPIQCSSAQEENTAVPPRFQDGCEVPPHPQGLQGSHLNLSQASAQRHMRYFLLNVCMYGCLPEQKDSLILSTTKKVQGGTEIMAPNAVLSR